MHGSGAKPSNGAFSARRLVPVFVLLALLALCLALGLDDYLSFETVRENRQALLALVERHAILSVIAFMAVYIGVVALSLPGGAALTITGGFLFGQYAATVYVVVAATLGATIVFVVARTALGDALRAKAGPWLKRTEAGFAKNALSYMLFLRLVPAFPFFVVNLVPAFLGVPLRTYVVGTLIGIVPATFVYATVGAGLGSVFASGAEFSPHGVLTPQVVTALVGLAILSLLPVFYKRGAGGIATVRRLWKR
jgi:uncharacterized membrane protein YdjX (TVP38/TMEM64 family)